ncbi:MAG TPA: hypothetical protein VFK14_00090 [Solirubrobacterales bacterium]|nr:hypothetical protein [Solirubrobacterales bacterium]
MVLFLTKKKLRALVRQEVDRALADIACQVSARAGFPPPPTNPGKGMS